MPELNFNHGIPFGILVRRRRWGRLYRNLPTAGQPAAAHAITAAALAQPAADLAQSNATHTLAAAALAITAVVVRVSLRHAG